MTNEQMQQLEQIFLLLSQSFPLSRVGRRVDEATGDVYMFRLMIQRPLTNGEFTEMVFLLGWVNQSGQIEILLSNEALDLPQKELDYLKKMIVRKPLRIPPC